MRDRSRTRVPVVAFGVTTVAGLGLLVLYWSGGQPQLEGLLWFYVLGGLGVGIVVSSYTLFPNDIVEEERHPLASTDEEIEAALGALDIGEDTVSERRTVLRMFGTALAAVGTAVVFPIRSLGPRPDKDLRETPFEQGRRLVRADASPVAADCLKPGEVVTTLPEGHLEAADAPTLLICYDEENFVPVPGREDWTAGGMVAYSKICTHAACGVGLYENRGGLLLCPCHQSTFDVNNGAKPTFGPATRALPQLPLAVDEEGYVIAAGDYSEPVGPGFWDRGSP